MIGIGVLSSLAAIPIGLGARFFARRHRQETTLALSGVFVALGTLCAWFVVVTIALGK